MEVTALLERAIELQNVAELDSAVALCRQAIALDPKSDDAYYVLACIFHRSGKLQEAIANISQAIDLCSIKAQYFNVLGACYLKKQESIAAELSFRQAIELQSENSDAQNNLGLLLLEKKRYTEAEQILEKARAFAPNDVNILCNLARSYWEREKLKQALALYEKARAIEAHNPSPQLGIVCVLQKMGRFEEALEAVNKIDATEAVFHAETLRLKMVLLSNLGRLNEACDVIDEALELLPDSYPLLNTRAQLRKVKADESFFNKLQEFESRVEGTMGSSRTSLCYALGKAFDDTGDIERASRYYAMAGASELQTRNYDEQNDMLLFAAIKRNCTREYLTTLAHGGSHSVQPIFVLGMERSGTTLVEQLLASHPDVYAGGELLFVSQALNGWTLPDGTQLSVPGNREIEPNASIAQRAEQYLKKINAIPNAAGYRNISNKLPANFMHLGLIYAMFPNARIIHCRRDPIDNCISSYTTQFATSNQWSFNLGTMGRRYREYWNLMAHWRRELPGKFLELRYEQVVENTEQSARMLLEWCGLPWNDKVMRFYETARPVMTASVAQVRQPIYRSSMGRWKKWEPYIQPLLSELGEIEKQYWAELPNSEEAKYD